MSKFNPYTDNGGTVLAIAGDDFCLVAADTRQSEGYSINCRYFPKTHKLSEKTVLATAFMAADCTDLVLRLRQRMELYYDAHCKTMSTTSIGQLISTMLYHKRFFPYYVFNVLGGLDEEGKGCVYSYDPVGNVERKMFTSAGSASSLIQPFLDNQCGFFNMVPSVVNPPKHVTLEQAKRLARDAFTSATERDIYTGDFLELYTITNSGVTKDVIELKKD